MGRKQWKNRKHLLFYSASLLIILVMTPCCVITDKLAKDKIHIQAGPMEPARDRMNNGDYEGARKAYSEVIKGYPKKSPGDRALFEMGILFAYPDNPKRNNAKASEYFKRIIRDFPESPLIRESLAWMNALDRINENDGKIRALLEENRSYKEQIKTLENKNRELEDQIRALKEIDIGIEEKKRQEAQ
jgi:outer membrane protein assembly factor BamD (BamD/ComL family)